MMQRREFLRLSAGLGAWAVMRMAGLGGGGYAEAGETFIPLPPLPFEKDALEPYISADTIAFHYGRHHSGYVKKINKFIAGTRYQHMPLEEIIVKTCGVENRKIIFNNAAQVYNHTFYWNSIKKDGGGEPGGDIGRAIKQSFGGYAEFAGKFSQAAQTQFGSGWAWLVDDGSRLKIVQTANADTPIAHGMKPLLTIDVWEHAYYLDYQNKRSDYIKAYLDHLVNWDFADHNLKLK